MDNQLRVEKSGFLTISDSEIVIPVFSIGEYSFIPAEFGKEISVEQIIENRDNLENYLKIVVVNTNLNRSITPKDESLYMGSLAQSFINNEFDFRFHNILSIPLSYANNPSQNKNPWEIAVNNHLKSGGYFELKDESDDFEKTLRNFTQTDNQYKISLLREPFFATLSPLEKQLSTGTNL
ncbi:MAG: hypothetical protein VXZ40_00580 [Nanoarchaeota archaeon]|nr:hypothetical protein [Nanoarchaeota archaeon]